MSEKKESLFKKIINFINRKFESNKYYEEKTKDNLFVKYIKDENEKDLTYNDVRLCADYCYEALKIAEKRLKILTNSEKINEQLIELDYIEHLTENDINKLNILCERHKNLIKENKTLLYQLTGFSNSIDYLKGKHREAEKSMAIIEEAEKSQRIFKNDINLLKYEKRDLIDEGIKMKNAISFINKISIGFIGITSFIALILGYLNIFTGRQIFYETASIVIFLIFYISLTYIFRLKIYKELKINSKLQFKITKLINKKKAVYAYYTSFLDVSYDKYNAKNAKDLKYNLDEYKQYEKILQRKDAAVKAYNETQREIEKFIEDKGIPCNTTIDIFVKNVSTEDRIRKHKKLTSKKKEADHLLNELDTKHKAYWQLINELNDNDQTNNKIIGNLIEKYYEEIEKVFERMNFNDLDVLIENELEEVDLYDDK